ncbi:MAG: hypothetical protein AB9873_19220 [Syntrophobacteraceae bacterium]
MYLTSFIHREELFDIVERWFCHRPESNDALRLTEILISDGFVIGETLHVLADHFLGAISNETTRKCCIQFKGELRDTICRSTRGITPRVQELFAEYRKNPDFFYREAPINGVMCLDETGHLVALYRVKRPRRIAEKANRRIASWFFHTVQDAARHMAEERASRSGIPIELLLTPEIEMVREFVEAEKEIAQAFGQGTIKLDRAPMSISDVGGIKVIADEEQLTRLLTVITGDPTLTIVEMENHRGSYEANSMILDVVWDPEWICRRFMETRAWEKYGNRGIPTEQLKKGIEPLLLGAQPNLKVELILATFPNMVESELGNSIHEQRIITQRQDKVYKGYIPMNVEFLLGYLFAVGFSPVVEMGELPFRLWGRYLPDTLVSHVRRLNRIPDYDLLY